MSHIMFSEGENSSQLSNEVSDLISNPESSWELSSDGKGLERSFKFKTFKTTWVRRPVNEKAMWDNCG
jgi:4a-hydroxytetrahydrobiopterin dehydratase